MNAFVNQSQNIPYKVIKSRRKSVSIFIQPSKEVIVRAPIQMSDAVIKQLVQSKSDWIIKKLAQMPEFYQEPQKDYNDGDKIFYRGKEYRLRVFADSLVKQSKIIAKEEEICVYRKVGEEVITKDLLILWYKEQARSRILERINDYQNLVQRPIKTIRIKSQKSRWGSCSSKGNLNFNWRIILMPDALFDYIIVHELCHLKQLNHSKQYWDLVKAILLDYKERERSIKQNRNQFEF